MKKTGKLFLVITILCIWVNLGADKIMGLDAAIADAAIIDDPTSFSDFVGAFGTTSSDSDYNAVYDLDNDSDIDGRDVFALLNEEDDGLPPAGNPFGECAIPSDAMEEDTSTPDQVIGNGTPASCTSQAVVGAIALGGIITFDCGPDPITITLNETAKIFNNTGPQIVVDGGGKVTLSGGNQRRILYMNTCDGNQVHTTSHCQDQDHPQLTIQNLTFINGNSKSETKYTGGGAVYAYGGRFKVVNCRFFNNVCADTGPDVGGAAIRAFGQYQDQPVYVVNSTFGGRDGLGNVGSNGGGISSIGVSWTIINSLFSYNEAIGYGGNPENDGTPGGGSGGAIYNDGNDMVLSLCGTRIEYNEVNQHGSGIFFVTNNHRGYITMEDTAIENNIGGYWYPVYPQISCHDDTPIRVDGVWQ
ncbi:hypothetical protein [Desulfosarcina variabilis]|uniref:hypothetical protein n=1 Tax=Desulfosarcina variabilis TaxID=2300 RepID=UPI003AFA091F